MKTWGRAGTWEPRPVESTTQPGSQFRALFPLTYDSAHELYVTVREKNLALMRIWAEQRDEAALDEDALKALRRSKRRMERLQKDLQTLFEIKGWRLP